MAKCSDRSKVEARVLMLVIFLGAFFFTPAYMPALACGDQGCEWTEVQSSVGVSVLLLILSLHCVRRFLRWATKGKEKSVAGKCM